MRYKNQCCPPFFREKYANLKNLYQLPFTVFCLLFFMADFYCIHTKLYCTTPHTFLISDENKKKRVPIHKMK